MDATGAFAFGGGLTGSDQATVVAPTGSGTTTTDGTFSSAAEQLAGFYIINAADIEEARVWADKVAVATNHPIELRPFHATGRVADHMPGGDG